MPFMVGSDERDLLREFLGAAFADVELTYEHHCQEVRQYSCLTASR